MCGKEGCGKQKGGRIREGFCDSRLGRGEGVRVRRGKVEVVMGGGIGMAEEKEEMRMGERIYPSCETRWGWSNVSLAKSIEYGQVRCGGRRAGGGWRRWLGEGRKMRGGSPVLSMIG